jgi:hypothetical protein
MSRMLRAGLCTLPPLNLLRALLQHFKRHQAAQTSRPETEFTLCFSPCVDARLPYTQALKSHSTTRGRSLVLLHSPVLFPPILARTVAHPVPGLQAREQVSFDTSRLLLSSAAASTGSLARCRV